MGLLQSSELREEEEEEEEEQQEEEERLRRREGDEDEDEENELEQEPELLPYESSAFPLSPQLSAIGSPRLGSAVRVWDPGHVLSTPASPLQRGWSFRDRSLSHRANPNSHFCQQGQSVADEYSTEVYLIRHGESSMNAQRDLVTGRSPSAVLTAAGKHQSRSLGVFLLSQGVHFDVVFTSPLERCKQTAISVCQEVNFPEENIEVASDLTEMSQGRWEGLRRCDVYTAQLLSVMANSHLDFHAPDGESQRQVEFRMVEFLNNLILSRANRRLSLPKNAKVEQEKTVKEDGKTQRLSKPQLPDDAENGSCMRGINVPSNVHTHAVGKGSRKSRLQLVSMAKNTDSSCLGENGTVDSLLENKRCAFETCLSEDIPGLRLDPFCIAIFSHAMAIKCLLRGLLGSDPHMTHRICIDKHVCDSVAPLPIQWVADSEDK